MNMKLFKNDLTETYPAVLAVVVGLLIFPLVLTGQPNPVGWASKNGGTTGGFGGTTVYVDNRDDLIKYVSMGNDPYIIFVQDTIELELYEKVPVSSNKTIFGVTENAMIRYGGLEIIGDNVIVQNLIIGDFYDGDWSGTTHSTDCITIYGENVWIDHCWLYAGADGLLDIRSGNGSIADFVTVSYCRFSDHNKVTLVGSSDSNTQDRGHLRVTFHHCWYDGTVLKGIHQRMPRVRFGDVHVFNNYYEALGSYGVAARIESDLVVESTYFRNTPNPHIIDDFGLGLEDPDLVALNNIYEQCSGSTATNGTSFTPAAYYTYTPDPAFDIPALVMNEAGPFNPDINEPPVAVTDIIDFSNSSGIVHLYVTDNDTDVDSDDLRLANFVGTPNGTGFIKENKIIYAPPATGSGIDTIFYSLVDTEGGADTGMVLIYLDESPNSINALGNSAALHIFPNPATQGVLVSFDFQVQENFHLELADILGRQLPDTLYNYSLFNQSVKVDTRNLEAGQYILSIRNGQRRFSKQILVTR